MMHCTMIGRSAHNFYSSSHMGVTYIMDKKPQNYDVGS